jgi:hypothetical protein
MFESARRALALLLTRFKPPAPPEDPYVSVRQPHRRNPGGRSAAVAVREPDPDRTADAYPTRRV